MPVVPLLAGLVAVLAVALVLLVAAGRRARASAPDEEAIADLRARLDALRQQYAEIGADVSELVGEAAAVTMEGAAREAGQRVSQPTGPAEPVPGPVDALYVSTTAPATVRRAPSPLTPSVPAPAPAAKA